MSSSLRYTIAVMLALAFTTPAQAALTSAGSGPLIVGVAPIEMRSEDPNAFPGDPSGKLNNAIARTVEDLFPRYIQRIFERSFDRPIAVVRTGRFRVSNGKLLADGQQPSEIPPVIIMPSITSTGSLGVRISARIVGFDQPTSSISYDFEEFLLLAPTANYGELDTKLSDLSGAIAKRIATGEAAPSHDRPELPRGIMQFYCVTASQPDNRNLQQLSRVLTLELPFHLEEAAHKRGLGDLLIQGLAFKDALSFCNEPGNLAWANSDSLQMRVATLSWDGILSPDPQDEKAFSLAIRVSDSVSANNYRRLKPVKMREGSASELDEVAATIIADFVEGYRTR